MSRRIIALASVLPVLSVLSVFAEPVNLALHKPYTFSHKPNYRLSTDDGDATQLTDGKYTPEGTQFWTEKEAVGWNYRPWIIVTIDLGKREPIGGASWSTAAGVGGVDWPLNLFVFTGDDKKTWRYLGDLREPGGMDETPAAYGKFSRFRFSSTALRGAGRYVAIMTRGFQYNFSDEIEVWRGEDAWLEEKPTGPAVTNFEAFARERGAAEAVRYRLTSDLSAILDQARRVGGGELVTRILPAAARLAEGISSYGERFDPRSPAILPLPGLHSEILALNAKVLQTKGMRSMHLWTNERWDPISMYEIPDTNSITKPLTLDLMRNEVRGATFNITQPRETPADLQLALKGFTQELRLELREVLFTDTSRLRNPAQAAANGYGSIASALQPMEESPSGGANLRVPAGGTRQIWLSSKRPTAAPGVYRGSVAITTSNGEPVAEVQVEVRIRDLNFPERPRLHVGGWDYMLRGAPHPHFIPDNIEAQQAFLRDHYVDSPWARGVVAPKGMEFDEDGDIRNPDELDYALWDEWVLSWPDARNYCVYLSARRSFHKEPMGTPRFDNMVGGWLRLWEEHIKTQGIDPRKLVVLLVDEPNNPERDERVIAWGRALRAANLKMRIFEDTMHREPELADPEVFAVCDILCPKNSDTLDTPTAGSNREFYLNQKRLGKTLWLYSCEGPAKLLDPINYYRSQMWQAFRIGAEASMYWAFGSSGGTGDSWRPYRQTIVEYSPYFVSPAGALESKQSEAIREGAQDYEYLSILADTVEKARNQGGDAEWISQAETLLTDGVDEALHGVHKKSFDWVLEKKRGTMDAKRIQILDLLEQARDN